MGLCGEKYKLAEHIENDDHCRKCRKANEEFNVVEICETGEGDVLQGEDRGHVSCHGDEVEDE